MRYTEPKPTPVPYSRPFFDRRDFQKLVEPLRCGQLTQGPQVARFEEFVAQYVGTTQAVATSTGGAALRLTLLAVGVGPGQDVLMPAFGDPAMANAVEHCGARPVFCDISLETFGIDPEQVRQRMTPVTTVVLAAHLFAPDPDVKTVGEICRARRLPLVEACGGALGGYDSRGHIGAFGLAGCFSFGPDDPLTTGEGGMVVTNHEGLAETLRLLRGDGTRRNHQRGPLMPEPVVPGHDRKLTDLQGALGLAQMEKLTEILAARIQVALRYDDLLAPLQWLRRPTKTSEYFVHGCGPYVCQVEPRAFASPEEAGGFRDRLLVELAGGGIGCRQPARAFHILDFYRKKYRFEAAEFPNALAADRLAMALPLYVGMSANEQNRVVQELTAAHGRILTGSPKPSPVESRVQPALAH